MSTEVNWKRVMWIALAFFIIYSNPAYCQSWECKFAVVNWKDAVVYTRAPLADDIDSMTAEVKTLGCVKQTEKTVLIIQSVTEGKPDVFMVVPKDWVISIQYLKMAEPAEETEKPVVPKPKEVGRAG